MAWVHLSSAARNAAVNGVADLIDASASAGLIRIYTGTAPASTNDAVTTQTLLATLTFSDPAFGDAAAGVATANAITQDSYADTGGNAAWARIIDSAGNVVFDCDVGETGATINLNTTTITEGAVVRITSGSISIPAGT